MFRVIKRWFGARPNPLELARQKREREKSLLDSGLSNSQAKAQVAREFQRR